MATWTEENQKLLIAIGKHGGSLILEASGTAALREISAYSPYPEDHFRPDLLPTQPGFYLWEGTIWYDDGKNPFSEPTDPDIEWQGEFKPTNSPQFTTPKQTQEHPPPPPPTARHG